MTRREKVARFVASALALAGAQMARAQVEEVVVTANKREQTVQDAPVSVTAFDTSTLERIGAQGFDDYVRRVPGLAYNEAGGRPHFVIRGLATENSNVNQQQTVTLYINDLPQVDTYAPLGTTNVTLFDIERVEILRGPQGTLFGSGSIGGAIRVITNKPKLDEYEAKVELGANTVDHGGEGFSTFGMVNIPVGDKFAFRFVGTHAERPGVVDQPLFGEKDVDETRSDGARLSALYQPQENLKFIASLFYQDGRPFGTPLIRATLPLTDNTAGDPYTSTDLVPSYTQDRNVTANLTADWDLGAVSLFSSTSYADKFARRITDISYSAASFSPDYVGDPIPLRETSEFQTHAFAQEVRVSSKDDQRLSWIVGGVYITRNRPIGLNWLVPGTEAFNPGLTYEGTDNPLLLSYHFKQVETALFGEVGYKLTDQWKLTLGGRAFRNEDDRDYPINWAFGPGDTRSVSTEEDGFTPRVVLTYQPDNRFNYYVSASEGYRVGGPNERRPNRPESYGPDKLWAYELGAKTSWLNNTLVLNTALFYNAWEDIQVSLRRDGVNSTENAGKAHTQGVELELFAAPTDRLSLSVAAAYVDAKSDTTDIGIDTARGGIRDGDQLPGSPSFSTSETARYKWPSVISGGDMFVDLAHRYVGSAFNGFNKDNPLVVKYGNWNQFDAKVGWSNEKYELTFFVDNVADDDSITNVINQGGGLVYLARLRPRTMGVLFRADF